MFAHINSLAGLALGLVLLAGLQEAAGQDSRGNTSDPPQVRVWTDRSGTHKTEAAFIDFKDGKVTLKKKDGTTVTVPLDTLSEADRDFVKQAVSGERDSAAKGEETGPDEPPEPRSKVQQHGRNVVEMNLSGRKKSSEASQPKEVVVTGVGIDPEKAVQNAFSQAIEQTVGVLVNAETKVENDQLIRDEILTYSKGYMEKFEIVKRWQEDGLHHATIRAVVAQDKLVAKLKGMKIAVQTVAGELTSRQFEFDAKNEEQAAEMFKKAIADFDMTKLTKVDIVGKPEITREGADAQVHVTVKLSPDISQWQKLSQNLRYVLATAATRRGGLARGRESASVRTGCQLAKQLEGDGMLVSLFTKSTVINARTTSTATKKGHHKSATTHATHPDTTQHITGEAVQWEVFRVPNIFEPAIKAAASRARYRLVCALLDENDKDLVRITALRSEGSIYRGLGEVIYNRSEYPLGDIWWIGPVWWRESSNKCMPVFEVTSTLEISQADLAKVAKTVAFLEVDKAAEHGQKARGTRSKHSHSR